MTDDIKIALFSRILADDINHVNIQDLLRDLIAHSPEFIDAFDINFHRWNGHGFDGTVTTQKSNQWVREGKSIWEVTTQKDNVKSKFLSDGKKRFIEIDVEKAKNTNFVFVTTNDLEQEEIDDWKAELNELHCHWKHVSIISIRELVAWLRLDSSIYVRKQYLGIEESGVGNFVDKTNILLKSLPDFKPKWLLTERDAELEKMQSYLKNRSADYLNLSCSSNDEGLLFISAATESQDIQKNMFFVHNYESAKTIISSMGAKATKANKPILIFDENFKDKVTINNLIESGSHVIAFNLDPTKKDFNIELSPILIENMKKNTTETKYNNAVVDSCGCWAALIERFIGVDTSCLDGLAKWMFLIGGSNLSNSADRDVVKDISGVLHFEFENYVKEMRQKHKSKIDILKSLEHKHYLYLEEMFDDYNNNVQTSHSSQEWRVKNREIILLKLTQRDSLGPSQIEHFLNHAQTILLNEKGGYSKRLIDSVRNAVVLISKHDLIEPTYFITNKFVDKLICKFDEYRWRHPYCPIENMIEINENCVAEKLFGDLENNDSSIKNARSEVDHGLRLLISLNSDMADRVFKSLTNILLNSDESHCFYWNAVNLIFFTLRPINHYSDNIDVSLKNAFFSNIKDSNKPLFFVFLKKYFSQDIMIGYNFEGLKYQYKDGIDKINRKSDIGKVKKHFCDLSLEFLQSNINENFSFFEFSLENHQISLWDDTAMDLNWKLLDDWLDTASDDEISDIQCSIREFLKHGKKFHKPSLIDKIENFFNKLNVNNLVKKHAWLFKSDYVSIDADLSNFREYYNKLSSMRENAVIEVYEHDNVKGLCDLIRISHCNVAIGSAFYKTHDNHQFSCISEIFAKMQSSDIDTMSVANFLIGFLGHIEYDKSFRIVEKLLNENILDDIEQNLKDKNSLCLLLSIPHSCKISHLLKSHNDWVREQYWRHIFRFTEDQKSMNDFVDNLLHYSLIDKLVNSRVWIKFSEKNDNGHFYDALFLYNLIIRILKNSNNDLSDTTRHEIEQFIFHIFENDVYDISENQKIDMELLYQGKCLSRSFIPVSILNKMSKDPAFFIDQIKTNNQFKFYGIKWKSNVLPGLDSNAKLNAENLKKWIIDVKEISAGELMNSSDDFLTESVDDSICDMLISHMRIDSTEIHVSDDILRLLNENIPNSVIEKIPYGLYKHETFGTIWVGTGNDPMLNYYNKYNVFSNKLIEEKKFSNLAYLFSDAAKKIRNLKR